MVDTLPLVVLSAGVLLVVVVLFGFTGCSLLVSDGTETEPVQTFTATLDENDTLRNRTVIVRIAASKLSARGTAKVFITVLPPTEGLLSIKNLHVSKASTTLDNPYDAADDLTEVQVALKSISVAETFEIDYVLDNTKDLLIAFETDDQSADIPFARISAAESENIQTFVSPGTGPAPPIHEAAVHDRQSGYDVLQRIYLVTRIDVA